MFANLVAKIHNAWLRLPVGIRTALSFSVAVLVASAIGLVGAFGWFVPTSTADAKGEVLAFLTYAVPVLAVLATQLIRSKVAPAIVAWFLGTFGFAPASKAHRAASSAGLRRGDIWVRT